MVLLTRMSTRAAVSIRNCRSAYPRQHIPRPRRNRGQHCCQPLFRSQPEWDQLPVVVPISVPVPWVVVPGVVVPWVVGLGVVVALVLRLPSPELK